jgi:hypothetical protein
MPDLLNLPRIMELRLAMSGIEKKNRLSAGKKIYARSIYYCGILNRLQTSS